MLFSIILYSLFVLLISSSIFVVFSSNAISAGLALIASFFITAIIYVMLNQEFIAVIQVLVYAGAIVVLFLFIIMLLNLGKQKKVIEWKNLQFWVSLACAFAFFFKIFSILSSWSGSQLKKGNYTAEQIIQKGSLELFSEVLFYKYLLAFEFIAITLLVSVIGAFILVRKK